MLTFPNEEQLLNEYLSTLLNPVPILIVFSAKQEAKAEVPILTTLFGIVMLSRLSEPRKAHVPMLVTEPFGIIVPLQPTINVCDAVSITAFADVPLL